MISALAAWHLLLALAAASALALLVRALLVEVFVVRSGSMEPTLRVGDRVIVAKFVYSIANPRHGDIVVWWSDQSPRSVKRVIALGGDVVEVWDHAIYVNGRRMADPSDRRPMQQRPRRAWVIPDHSVFLLGDNRERSRDSRDFGPVHRSRLVGRASFLVWPPRRMHSLLARRS